MPKKTNGSGMPELDTMPHYGPDLGPLLTRQEVLLRTTLSAAQLDFMRATGVFPLFIRPGGPGTSRLALPERVLDGWFESMVELRDSMCVLPPVVTLPTWTFRLPSGDFPTGLRVLRGPDVEPRIKYRRSHRHRLVKAGRFPRPIPVSARCRAWLVFEVEDWIRASQEQTYGPAVFWEAGTSLRDCERRDRAHE